MCNCIMLLQNIYFCTFMPMNILLDNQYCPPISYFALLLKAEKCLIEKHENFVKSSNRNRCRIAGPNGLQMLSIPIESGKSHRQLFNEIKSSNAIDWQKNHWQSLCSSYRRSPYFEFYEDELEPLFANNSVLIFDSNTQIIEKIIGLLKLDITLNYTASYQKDYDGFLDARNLYKENSFSPTLPPYIQVFGDRHPFLNDISIIDLLFNQGPQAKEYLHQLADKITIL
jgi:WbqC-like protein family